MAAAARKTYAGTGIKRHRAGRGGGHRSDTGRHHKGWLANFLASFSKPTKGYEGRHRSDRGTNSARGVGRM
jgi:hypothetical protein